MTTNRFDQLKQIFNIDDEIEENDDLPTEDQIHEAMELADTLSDRLSVAQDQVSDQPVSYTHLTLPTILRV